MGPDEDEDRDDEWIPDEAEEVGSIGPVQVPDHWGPISH